MSITIDESGMNFGPLDKNIIYHMEKSKILENMRQRFKIVEFVLIDKNNKTFFVEAKSSSPKKIKHSKFIDELYDKYLYSLLFYIAQKTKRFSENELNKSFCQANLSKEKFFFVLVIKNHDPLALDIISQELTQKLKPLNNSLNNCHPQSIIAVNEDLWHKYFTKYTL